MSPTAKTTLKKVYKVQVEDLREEVIVINCYLIPCIYHLIPVLSDKNFHKDKTFNAHKAPGLY